METIKLKVDGMHCKGCSLGLEENLEKLTGVKSASVSLESGIATVETDGSADVEELCEMVVQSGFKATLL